MSGTDELLPIGVLARSLGISESTIRRMEAAGLLTPAMKSDSSSYRYYDSGNISRIIEILTLKSFGVQYAEMREHFDHPGDYTLLYQSLLDKQRALSHQIDRLRRRLRADGDNLVEFLEYRSAYCYTREVELVPDLPAFSEVAQQLQFDAIKKKLPISYTLPIMIITDCRDFREFDETRKQPLTFCLPLVKQTEGKDIRLFPGRKALSVHLSTPMNNFPDLIRRVSEVFRARGLRQNGVMTVGYDVGSYMGQNIPIDATVLHALIPYETDTTENGAE